MWVNYDKVKVIQYRRLTCMNSWQCNALAFFTMALKHSASVVKSLQASISARFALISVRHTLNNILDPS